MDASRVFLLLVVVALAALSTLFVLPYLQFFVLAVVLAYVLWPAQRWLVGRVPERVAAAALTVVATVALILPLVVVVRVVAADAAALVRALQAGDLSLTGVETGLEELTGTAVDLEEQLRALASEVGTGAFDSLLGAAGALTHVLVGLGLTLFLLYFFLKDGGRLLAWLRWLVPLSGRVFDELVDSIDAITRAVLAGHVLVAIIQGGLAGLGLFVVGIPNAVFWTAVMIVLSLLPLVGSFLVWGPAVAYLLLLDRPVAALALLIHGTIVVGVSDDYLRPVIVDRYAAVSPAVIIIGVLGGLTVLGFVGVFVGPVVIGVFRATLDVYREEYGFVANA